MLVLSKQVLHLVHGLLLHRGEHMAVHIECGRDTAMPQQLLDHFDGDLHRQQDGCSAVPEIVKAHVRQARLFHQRCEEVIEAGGIQKSAVDITEHEIMFFPGWTGLQLCFELPDALLLKCFYDKGRECDAPFSTGCFRLAHAMSAG